MFTRYCTNFKPVINFYSTAFHLQGNCETGWVRKVVLISRIPVVISESEVQKTARNLHGHRHTFVRISKIRQIVCCRYSLRPCYTKQISFAVTHFWLAFTWTSRPVKPPHVLTNLAKSSDSCTDNLIFPAILPLTHLNTWIKLLILQTIFISAVMNVDFIPSFNQEWNFDPRLHDSESTYHSGSSVQSGMKNGMNSIRKELQLNPDSGKQI